MERYPFGVVRQNKTGCDHQFSEVVWIDAHVFVSLEIDPVGTQKVDGLGRVHVLPGSRVNETDNCERGKVVPLLDVEVKVELPGADVLREVPIFVRESQPDLNRFE